MKKYLPVVLVLFLGLFSPIIAAAQIAELDAYWAEVTRTVTEGDFEGYAALYHPDAVLVFEGQGSTMPVAQALDGWKSGFESTLNGEMTAGVVFKFSQRLNDGTTAHEKGIFRYWYTPSGGEETVQYVHFEGLLVKKDGWIMLMEYQKTMATEEEWAAMD